MKVGDKYVSIWHDDNEVAEVVTVYETCVVLSFNGNEIPVMLDKLFYLFKEVEPTVVDSLIIYRTYDTLYASRVDDYGKCVGSVVALSNGKVEFREVQE